MLRKHMAACLMLTALTAAPALAQTQTNTGSQNAPGGGQFLTQQSPNHWRGSRLVGLVIYGANNERIGDVNEVLVNQNGNAEAIVIGVGGFLGIGEKDVAIPFKSVEWRMTADQSRTAANTGGANTTSGAGNTGVAGAASNAANTVGNAASNVVAGVTGNTGTSNPGSGPANTTSGAPNTNSGPGTGTTGNTTSVAPPATGTAANPTPTTNNTNTAATANATGTARTGGAATTTGTAGTAGTGTAGSANRSADGSDMNRGYPDHGVVRMSRADLENAPTFRYAGDTSGTGANTNAPARTGTGTNAPGGTGNPSNAPR